MDVSFSLKIFLSKYMYEIVDENITNTKSKLKALHFLLTFPVSILNTFYEDIFVVRYL